MLTQTNTDETGRATQAPSDLSTPRETSTARKSSYQERQGMAMAWLWSTMLLFFLLAGLALGAALVFHVGFIGWLISLGLMGGVVVATVVAINYYLLRPEH